MKKWMVIAVLILTSCTGTGQNSDIIGWYNEGKQILREAERFERFETLEQDIKDIKEAQEQKLAAAENEVSNLEAEIDRSDSKIKELDQQLEVLNKLFSETTDLDRAELILRKFVFTLKEINAAESIKVDWKVRKGVVQENINELQHIGDNITLLEEQYGQEGIEELYLLIFNLEIIENELQQLQ